MANKFDKNKTIRGSFGKAWLNGERMSNVKSFEAKASLEYEEMDVNGDLGKKQRYMGYTIEGTATLHKFDSSVASLLADGIMTGDMPEIKLVAALDDPTAYGAERVELYGVTFDELTLMKFENKGLIEEEVPFKAEGFKYIDKI